MDRKHIHLHCDLKYQLYLLTPFVIQFFVSYKPRYLICVLAQCRFWRYDAYAKHLVSDSVNIRCDRAFHLQQPKLFHFIFNDSMTWVNFILNFYVHICSRFQDIEDNFKKWFCFQVFHFKFSVITVSCY